MKSSGSYKHILSLLAVLGLGIFSSGCAVQDDIDAFLKPHQVNTTSDDYILQPPDIIEINSARVPEIHQMSQQYVQL